MANVRALGFRLIRFAKCSRGATAIEYALIASGIAMAIVTVLFSVGEALDESYQSVADSFPDTE